MLDVLLDKLVGLSVESSISGGSIRTTAWWAPC